MKNVERRPSSRLPSWIRWLAWTIPGSRREDLLGDLEEAQCGTSSASPSFLTTVRWILGTGIRLRWLAAIRPIGEVVAQLEALPMELRAALRQFRSSPLYSGSVLATVGVATCVAVMAGSLAAGTLRPAFPYADADGLVAVFVTERDGAEFRNPVSPGDYADWAEQTSLSHLTAARPWSPALLLDGRSTKLEGLLATPELFELLGVDAAAGVPFSVDALSATESPVVIASSLAKRIGLSREDIGTRLILDGEPRVLAAIMSPDFLFPPFWMADAEIWAPLDMRGEGNGSRSRGARFLRVFGRLAPGTSVGEVQLELDAWAARAHDLYPTTNAGVGARVEHLVTPSVEQTRLPLLALFGASVALLLLIEVNLALLLVARTAMRARELAVRSALGASAARIRLILLCETTLLVAAGTVIGVSAAPMLMTSIEPLAADLLPRFSTLRVDGLVVAALVPVQAVCVLLVSRTTSPAAPRGSRLRSRGPSAALASRRTFVIAEVAITACLLLTATLLLASFERLSREELGFDAEGAISVRLDLSRAVEEDRRRSALADLEERLSAEPQVAAAGIVNHLPIRGDLWRTRIFGVGQTPEDVDIRAAYRMGSTGSLEALGLRMVFGRWIESLDGPTSAPTVVINRRAAEVLWPGVAVETLLDREVALGSLGEAGSRRRIVGVVENVKQTGISDVVIPEIYLPLWQADAAHLADLTVILRGRESEDLRLAVRRAALPLGPAAVLSEFESLNRVVADDLLSDRTQAGVATGFALFALVVAGFGVFALVGTVGSARSQEFAIRRVLGSTRGSILLQVLSEGAWLGGLGAVVGLVTAGLFAGTLEPLLFGLDPLAPAAYGVVGVVTVLVAVVVSLPSAWRAAREPIVDAIER